MKYALGNMLNGYGVRGLDADAKAYIDAVVAAGATVTSTQRNAINAFIKNEKSGSRWSLHKRIYLPIWGIAAPNAICMTSLTSGTWVNAPTMAAGYVQGNGTTQAFNPNTSFSSIGFTTSSAGVWALINQADSRTSAVDYISTVVGGSLRLWKVASGSINFTVGSTAVQVSLANNSHNGIISANRLSTTSTIYRRDSIGTSVLTSNTAASSGTIPTGSTGVMAIDVGGSYVNHTDARFGGFGFTLPMTQAQNDLFTSNLKTLWETSTGLLLP